MKVVSFEIIPFRVPRQQFRPMQEPLMTTAVQTVTKVVTDSGAEGYYFGGAGHGDQDGLGAEQRNHLRSMAKGLLVGKDPFDREKYWREMWIRHLTPENFISTIDMVLWDLQARMYGVPVHKLLGACRTKALAYASTYPNMHMPEDYARHALECKQKGYKAYKIHPYYFWDPVTRQPDPGIPSHIDYDLATCRLVREAVGEDMVLMYDPWGTYRTYEEALKVGRELEKLNFYWYEHPMPETRMEQYVKLAAELSIPILSPEIVYGSIFSRADWILRKASDMSRIDVLRGGITGCMKMAHICEAFGVKLEMHMAGFGNLQILGATSEDTCTYYERGLMAPGIDTETPLPYLSELCDPVDSEGYVRIPQEPGMGYKGIKWDYIQENRIAE